MQLKENFKEKNLIQLLPAVRMLTAEMEKFPLCRICSFAADNSDNKELPDDILKIELKIGNDINETINSLKILLVEHKNQYKKYPDIIYIPGTGSILCGFNKEYIDQLADYLEDKIPEVPQKNISAEYSGKVFNKVAVVTGGAQGFGKGIVSHLLKQGANVIIADINQEVGMASINELNKNDYINQAYFEQADVSNDASVKEMIENIVCRFGGIDIFISNAGVLRAGSLSEMDEKTFEFVTSINYKGYFLCAKHVSEVMKIQHTFNDNYYMDIIQINSKSGLAGSNKNFAYAGGKFGGIGLTQSFALELIEYNIKVNSICPGNFFDGPLWSDPKNGLFVQYLDAGKVPGAKTIEDVKHFYEAKVPMKRGCMVEDVAKAIFYVVEQQYETGQALPVTGGQIMLK